jgi:ribosomal protein S27E
VLPNYLGLYLKGFRVIGYYINETDENVKLKLKCERCGNIKYARLLYERVVKVRCKECGRNIVIVPLNYYEGTKFVKDMMSLGYFQYKEMRREVRKDNDINELEYIRNKIKIGGL